MSPNDRRLLYRRALNLWGKEPQLAMLHEEIGELLVAVGHWRRDRVPAGDVVNEIADVRIMLEQLVLILGFDVAVDEAMMDVKLERLLGRVTAASGGVAP